MKDPIDVLRVKERELSRIKIELQALQITARLLSDDHATSDLQKPDCVDADDLLLCEFRPPTRKWPQS